MLKLTIIILFLMSFIYAHLGEETVQEEHSIVEIILSNPYLIFASTIVVVGVAALLYLLFSYKKKTE